ncbi:Hypothetical protein HDN1F_25360 [gamma proteobacterium HdN1]|nr:Hypothetical protein HDN1F_25360 [gamma proteobacterium HdN1]
MITFQDDWFSASDDNNGIPVFLRARDTLDHLIGLESHPTLVRLVWIYKPVGEHGLPSDEDAARMTAFEQTVMPALEAERICIFYCIYQHNGQQEWLAYCSNVDAAEEIINVALMEHEEYPIELLQEDDPEWEDYKNMREGTGQSR